MKLLYDRKVSDRMQILWSETKKKYQVYMDDDCLSENFNAKAAVNQACDALKERAAQREADRQAAAEQAAVDQHRADDAFLLQLARRLGLEEDDLTQLVDIIVRRIEDND